MATFLQDQHHRNIMELLVYEEIAQQMSELPQHLQREINVITIAAYALNRIPPLYTTSREQFYEEYKTRRITMMPRLSLLIKEAFETTLNTVSPSPHTQQSNPIRPRGYWPRTETNSLAIA